MASRYERQVAFELAAAELIVVAREFRAGGIPKPRQLLGAGIVFGAISLFELGGESWQKFGSMFGLFVVLAMGMATIAAEPDLFGWLTSIGSSQTDLFPSPNPPVEA